MRLHGRDELLLVRNGRNRSRTRRRRRPRPRSFGVEQGVRRSSLRAVRSDHSKPLRRTKPFEDDDEDEDDLPTHPTIRNRNGR
jgi:hypothetical protein